MKIIIIGSGGRLGAALLREYSNVESASRSGSDLGLGRQSYITGFNHAQLDLADLAKVRQTIEPLDFDLMINAAAFTNVDLAEKEKEQAFKVNADAPRLLAEMCRDKNAKLIHVSTDYVFKGDKNEPYAEEDEPNPVSVYGESKFAGEQAVLSVNDRNLVVRVSWVFGPDRPSFVDQMIARAKENDQIAAVADKWSTPTYTRDIGEMLMRVVEMGGILHIANAGACTWQEYAQHAINCCRESGVSLKAMTVDALKMGDMKTWIARRPVYSVLGTRKYQELTGHAPRPWRDAVAEYVREFIARR